ncbi:SRPBCC domain-containing protein [Nonomuraea pusilla]|uniref:SRPBCC family protein n=1 Tax=Nonomuraea pusilla TaxID=46177 RepID=UPI0033349430
MGHSFELPQEAEVGATPEEVWEAIATGPGIDSWFMGRTEVAGGVVRTAFGGYAPETAVTASEPPHRFAHAAEPAPDGRFVAYEFLVEGRGRDSTVLRMVTSGFLPGDDWENEFEAMGLGLGLFFATLVQYLTHFRGRAATPVTAFGPPVRDWPRAWELLHAELGVNGETARVEPPGLPPAEGVVYRNDSQTFGVRTGDAIYRFMRGFDGRMVAAHHLFTAPPPGVEAEWAAWLEKLLAGRA